MCLEEGVTAEGTLWGCSGGRAKRDHVNDAV